ncbi:MAG TPA: hypothetical protein VI338_01655, partial [Nitrososphaera sp.]|nr:hypothetical protein [Nitrososphaera sp.]
DLTPMSYVYYVYVYVYVYVLCLCPMLCYVEDDNTVLRQLKRQVCVDGIHTGAADYALHGNLLRIRPARRQLPMNDMGSSGRFRSATVHV